MLCFVDLIMLLKLNICNCDLLVCWSQGFVNWTQLVPNGTFDEKIGSMKFLVDWHVTIDWVSMINKKWLNMKNVLYMLTWYLICEIWTIVKWYLWLLMRHFIRIGIVFNLKKRWGHSLGSKVPSVM